MVDSIHKDYFVFDLSKYIFYTAAILYVVLTCIVVSLQPLIYDPGNDCEYESARQQINFKNPEYVYNPCRFDRKICLLLLTVEECEFGRRLVYATIFGSLIGWERRNADRPAGVRTMSLVALGACLFSICSAFAFLSGPMSWDSSRVAAAIPSGVGFLGSALIFKHTANDGDGSEGWHEVHGLTTAASVWISAAVGIACAGGMYFIASISTAIVLVMLRFGPRTNYQVYGDELLDDEDSIVESEVGDNVSILSGSIKRPADYQSMSVATDPEMQAMFPNAISQRSSRRSMLAKTLSDRKLRPSLM